MIKKTKNKNSYSLLAKFEKYLTFNKSKPKKKQKTKDKQTNKTLISTQRFISIVCAVTILQGTQNKSPMHQPD